MKCPNCASDVPDVSNFCGICGFDVRPARAASAQVTNTVVLDSAAEAERVRAQVDEAVAQRGGGEAIADRSKTVFDVPPQTEPEQSEDLDMGSTIVETPIPKSASVEEEPQYAPPPAIESTSIELKPVSGDSAPGVQMSVQETFASMPAIKPAEDGQFRETHWFMAAQNPEHIENIQNVVPGDLEQQYVADGDPLDSQVRKQFSLNAENQAVKAPDVEHSSSDLPARRGGNIGLIMGVVGLIALGVAIFLVMQKT